MNPALINLPLILIGVGIVVLLAAIRVLVQQRRIVEVVPHSQVTIEVPAKWDETEIKSLLLRYQNHPSVLSHAVSSIRARLIMNQDLKTAQTRLRVISGVIELFKLNKDLQGLLHDLHLAEKEFAIKQIETDIRHEDAQARLTSERKLRELKEQRDELTVKKEIAQLQQDIRTIDKPAETEQRLSPAQQRLLKKVEIEEQLQRLKADETAAVGKAATDEEKRRVENMYADRREQLTEQLGKLL